MDMIKKESSSGYGNPPWVFKGRALYQLHLVNSEIARSFIPKEFRLVEAFGYTLGGFFLANYDESPAGIFDELVVIAGIVWNPPTSCAWAARVLVDSDKACIHGRKYVGLPSEVARFSKMIAAKQKQPKHKLQGLFNTIGVDTALYHPKDRMDIHVAEVKGPAVTDICTINTTTVSRINDVRMGPEIRMSLPSFSGRTEYCRDLLKYSCQITSRIRLVKPAKVFGPVPSSEDTDKCSEEDIGLGSEKDGQKLIASVMLSKPILALEFSCLNMHVEAPTVI